MQRLLRTAGWDVDGVRDDLRGYVLGALGDPAGVFVIDETGFIKKSRRSAGAQRQYTDTSGKMIVSQGPPADRQCPASPPTRDWPLRPVGPRSIALPPR
jgi:hypothetical protein